LTEEQLAKAGDADAEGVTPREQAALRFGKRLCYEWPDLSQSDYDDLLRVFTEREMVEVVTLSAWQFGGPNMLTSWGAESYKRDGKVVLEALPVRLAYAGAAKSPAPHPPIPHPPMLSIPDLITRAAKCGSPPPGWLNFLSPHPFLPSTWGALYEAVVEGGIVENRIKQLQRVLLAEYVRCPEWAPEASASLTAAGIGSRERAVLRERDLTVFSRREQAALRYTEGLVGTGQVSDAVFDDLKAQFTESEIVELGYAVSVQNGASRVFRSLLGTKWIEPRSSRHA
jgi:alkylhydroperoxidase family enzyme